MTETEKALIYYKAVAQSTPRRPLIPQFIPQRVELPFSVNEAANWARMGVYDATCNKYGAVSVDGSSGKLGIKLNEFEVVEWAQNPHWPAK